MWGVWWVWIVAGFALGVLEVLAPGYIFLGFAMGALITGVLVGIGVLGTNVSVLLAAFAVASLLAWLGLRRVLGVRKVKSRMWDRDIND